MVSMSKKMNLNENDVARHTIHNQTIENLIKLDL